MLIVRESVVVDWGKPSISQSRSRERVADQLTPVKVDAMFPVNNELFCYSVILLLWSVRILIRPKILFVFRYFVMYLQQDNKETLMFALLFAFSGK